MKVLYRPHKGSLDLSMSECVLLDSIDDMKRHIVQQDAAVWGNPLLSESDIVIGDIEGDDERIGWKDYRHVCTKKYGKDDYMKLYDAPQCIGYCSIIKD